MVLSSLISLGAAVRGITIFNLSWLEFVGFVCSFAFIFYQIPQFILTIYNTWISPSLGHYVDLMKMGKWAVVTGASDGVGKAYAEELARLGINVVLISRTKEKLEKVARDIETNFNVQTKIIVKDFTEGTHIYPEIQKEIQDLEIGILVNNVGMWYPYPEYFMELPNGDKYCQDLIFCNVVPITMMTRLVLPQMVERKKGVIVNIGSLSSTVSIPLMTVYAATKSYIDQFSQSLAVEYRDKGIIVQTILPAYVATKMSRVSKPSWTSPSPTVYVQQALKTIGIQDRTAVHIPHRLSMRAFQWYSFYCADLAARGSYNCTLLLRSRAIAKRLRNKAS